MTDCSAAESKTGQRSPPLKSRSRQWLMHSTSTCRSSMATPDTDRAIVRDLAQEGHRPRNQGVGLRHSAVVAESLGIKSKVAEGEDVAASLAHSRAHEPFTADAERCSHRHLGQIARDPSRMLGPTAATCARHRLLVLRGERLHTHTHATHAAWRVTVHACALAARIHAQRHCSATKHELPVNDAC